MNYRIVRIRNYPNRRACRVCGKNIDLGETVRVFFSLGKAKYECLSHEYPRESRIKGYPAGFAIEVSKRPNRIRTV